EATEEVRDEKRLQGLRQRYSYRAIGRHAREVSLVTGPRAGARPGIPESAPEEAFGRSSVRATVPATLPPRQWRRRWLGIRRPAHGRRRGTARHRPGGLRTVHGEQASEFQQRRLGRRRTHP